VIAVLDASVLYPAPLRDLFMHLAVLDVFQARWTEQIHDEWTRNVVKNRKDITSAQLERTRILMNSHVREGLVERFEHLIQGLTLPDPDDRHVLAAAIAARADCIVTANLKHFPPKMLEPYGVTAIGSDDFLIRLFERDQDGFIQAVRAQRNKLRRPPITGSGLLSVLERQGLKRLVSELKEVVDLL
jgi:predicted nucleic acid-binding protein